MKHLFVVNSHTTFLTTLGVIDYLQLPSEDILLILVRHYKNSVFSLSYKAMDMSWGYNVNVPNHWFSFKHFIKRIDNEISGFVDNNEYVMYAPCPGGVRLYQLIFTNPLCVGFNYLQEGALVFGALFEEKPMSLFNRLYDTVLNVLYNHRVWAARFSWRIPNYLENKVPIPETYAISNDIFSKSGLKINIIKWPKYNVQNTKYDINPSFPCFIFESSVELGVIEKDIYMHFVKELIIKKGGDMNYVKFHPYQFDDNKKLIISLFTELGKKCEELAMDFPFELYLSSYGHMKVYGFNSSLLVYARQMGHETFSMENELLSSSDRYRSWTENRL